MIYKHLFEYHNRSYNLVMCIKHNLFHLDNNLICMLNICFLLLNMLHNLIFLNILYRLLLLYNIHSNIHLYKLLF